MIKLYRFDKHGMLRHVDFGYPALIKAYLKAGYVVLTKKERKLLTV